MPDNLDFYQKHRPQSFKRVHGQPDAVAMLESLLREKRLPHAIMLTGPSGCGKTTLARILKGKLNCDGADFQEINCGLVESPIDTIRSIQTRMTLAPLTGTSRIWLLDEVQSLSRARFAQEGLLKILEDMPSHVYFFLCTTDPSKLLKTIITRCTEVKLGLLDDSAVKEVVSYVAKKESMSLSDEVVNRIVEVAEGSARKALVILQQIMGIEGEEAQLEAILSSDTKRQAIDIARALINPRTQWASLAAILKEVDDDPETIRRIILGYASSCLLGNSKGIHERAYRLIEMFRDPFYDVGKPGLVSCCYALVGQRG